MAEIRVSHLFFGLIALAVVGAGVLVVVGALVIPQLDLGWFKTPELSQQSVNKALDTTVATAGGFTPAKTPTEALDQFRAAVNKRDYKIASRYATKPYAEMLEASYANAAALGASIEKIRDFAKEKGLMTEKLTYLLYQLDPLPRNFKAGPDPVQDGDRKARGYYAWELPIFVKAPPLQYAQELKNLDHRMFITVLGSQFVLSSVEVVKDGDAWKLNVPVTPDWNASAKYFNERAKAYQTALDSFAIYLTNDRFRSAAEFEEDVVKKLREAK